jgi:hypothetical protein
METAETSFLNGVEGYRMTDCKRNEGIRRQMGITYQQNIKIIKI